MINQELEKQLDYEAIKTRQLDTVFAQLNMTSVASLFAALMIVVLHYNTPIQAQVMLWFGLICAHYFARYVFILKPLSQRINSGQRRNLKAEHRFVMWAWFISGSFFGVAGYLFLPTLEQPVIFVGMILIYAGLIAGNLQNFYWTSRLAGAVFIHPLVLGLLLRTLEYEYYFFFFQMLTFVVIINTLITRISSQLGKAAMKDVHNQRLMREMQIQRDQSDSANQEKTQFITAANHDIRQPLNSMGMFLFSLKQEFKHEPNERLVSLKGIESAHQTLTDLFSALSEVAVIDDHSQAVNRQAVSADFVLETIVGELDETATSKGLTIRYIRTGFTVDTDPFLISRLCRNLIGNAIKYTPSGGQINISGEQIGSTLILHISDTGIGISQAHQKRIFDEYYQIQNLPRGQREGLGLGLSIVKRIADLLDHRIQIKSDVGQGSTFSIELPIVDEVVFEEAPLDQYSGFYGLRILVVDDEAEILNSMQRVLSVWGCDVLLADSPEKTMEIVGETRPDLIFCDQRIGAELTGLELLAKLQEEFDLNVPSFLITGDIDYSIREKALINKVECLYKPISPETLHKAIDSAIT